MVERRPPAIPRAVRDAAADWVERGQHTPGPAFDRALTIWISSSTLHRVAYDEALIDWQSSAELAHTRTGLERNLVRAPLLMRRSMHIAAASVGSALLVLFALVPANLLRPVSVVSEASAQTLTTAKGEIRTVTLADGSKVTLDTETVVRVLMTAKERRASLSRGRARFDVTADPVRPFVIEAHGREVKATQATFDISVGTQGIVVSTIVGRVELLPGSSSASDGDTVVAGEQIDTTSQSSIRNTDPQTNQWVSGMLVFDATPLGDAITAMNRYNRVAIRIPDQQLARLTVSGAFRVSDNEGFVKSIARMYNLHMARDADGTLTLTRTASAPLPQK